jgi:hypothetical protein
MSRQDEIDELEELEQDFMDILKDISKVCEPFITEAKLFKPYNPNHQSAANVISHKLTVGHFRQLLELLENLNV